MAIAKREKAWKLKIAPGKQYPIDDALKMIKEFATAKFNETDGLTADEKAVGTEPPLSDDDKRALIEFIKTF